MLHGYHQRVQTLVDVTLEIVAPCNIVVYLIVKVIVKIKFICILAEYAKAFVKNLQSSLYVLRSLIQALSCFI